jgi:hypothetical protein
MFTTRRGTSLSTSPSTSPSTHSPVMARHPPRITFVVNNRRANRVLQVRRRRRTYVRQQVSPMERKRRRDAMHLNTAALDTAIEEWYQLTMKTAQELAKRFSHRPRWILDKMFYRGAHVKKRNKTNAWNAWASQMCAKVNAGMHHILSCTAPRLTEYRTQRGRHTFTHGNPRPVCQRVCGAHSHPEGRDRDRV